MGTTTSFIDVNHLFVEIAPPKTLLSMLGSTQPPKSVLRDITFELPHAIHVTVFGREASGKTTLLRTLAGAIKPTKGTIKINGQLPMVSKHLAAGYVSIEESEPLKETGYEILSAFAKTHSITDAATRINHVGDILNASEFLHAPAETLSTTQRIRLNLARAALSDSPLILLDDCAEFIGPGQLRDILPELFANRTVLITTRFADVAETLQLPLLLLHHGSLTHQGTIDEISSNLSCPRIVDIWVEGLRYDLLRNLRRHAGVKEARLLPTTGFSGQRLRVQLQSARYLPAMYDLVSQAPLIRVEELPPSLNDIIARL